VEDFLIDFETLYKHLGYSRKDNAKRVLKKLQENQDYRPFHTSVERFNPNPKERIFLTLRGAQRFALSSETERGKEIAKTIIRIFEVLVDYDLLSIYMRGRRLRHDAIVEWFSNYPVVYLADVFFLENGGLRKLKKIGWTNNISSRQDTLSTDMKTTCIFTHAFKCVQAYRLEQRILKEPIVAEHLFIKPINGHTSTETIQFSDKFNEQQLNELIKLKLPEFNICSVEHDLELRQKELEQTKLAIETKRLGILEIFMKQGLSRQNAEQLLNNMESSIIVSPIPVAIIEKQSRKNSRGYKVQRIDPNNPGVPIAVYESALDVTRHVEGASKARIINAIKENTLYMGSRWWKVNEGDDETIVHNLPEIQMIRKSSKGLVVKLNKEATVIKGVFANQRDAMKEAQLTSPGAISMAIKNDTLSYGHRYRYWSDCSDTLRNEWINLHGNPDEPETVGKRLQRLNPLTGEVIETYNTLEFVVKHFQVSRASIKKAISENKICKGWRWKFLE